MPLTLTKDEELALLEALPTYLQAMVEFDEAEAEGVEDGTITVYEDLKAESDAYRVTALALLERLQAALPDRGPSLLERAVRRCYVIPDEP